MRSKTPKRTVKKSKPAPQRTVEPPSDLARVAEVFAWIVRGHTEANIAEAVREKWPDAEGTPLIVAALAQITKSADVDARLIRGWCIEAYRELHRRLTEMGDYVGAVRAVARINDLAERCLREPANSTAETTSTEEAAARAHLGAALSGTETASPQPSSARLAATALMNSA